MTSANGLLFWPLTIFLVVLGLLWLRRRRSNLVSKQKKPAETISESKKLLLGGQKRYKVSLIKKGVQEEALVVFFKLEDPEGVLGLPAGQAIRLYGQDSEGEFSSLFYPVSKASTKGSFVVIDSRVGSQSEADRVSEWLEELKPGQSVDLSGPEGDLCYLGASNFLLGKQDKRKFSQVSFIVYEGHVFSVVGMILHATEENAKISFSMLYGAESDEGFFFSGTLDGLDANNLLDLKRTVDDAPEYWDGHKGHITPELITDSLPPPKDSHLVVLSGPKELTEDWQKMLADLGFAHQNVYTY